MRTHTHTQSSLAIPEQEAILALYLLSPSESASPPQPSRPGRVIYSTLGTGEDIDLTALPSSSCLGSTEVGRGRAGGLRGRAGGRGQSRGVWWGVLQNAALLTWSGFLSLSLELSGEKSLGNVAWGEGQMLG